MEHFYTTFDATNDDYNLVGLSFEIDTTASSDTSGSTPESPSSDSSGGFAITLVVIILVVLLLIVGLVFGAICIRKRQKQRLEKAKNYFKTL